MPLVHVSHRRRIAIVAVGAFCIMCTLVAIYGISIRVSQGVSPLPQRIISVDGSAVRVSIADTPESRARGLGGRAGLGGDEGMLFVFPTDGRYAFWMKDMRFAIDIVWISSDGVIVDMEQSVQPESYPRPFMPGSDARYVLELPAGYVHAHVLTIGDSIAL